MPTPRHVQPADRADPPGRLEPVVPWWSHPLIRAGGFAFAVLMLAALTAAGGWALLAVRIVVFPLLLALFPAALLAPAVGWLSDHGLRRSLASLLVLLASAVVIGLAVSVVVPQVAGQFTALSDAVRSGVSRLDGYLAARHLRLPLRQSIDAIQSQASGDGRTWAGLFRAVHTAIEALIGAVLGLVALFFYLRDGESIAASIRDLFPRAARHDVDEVGRLVWRTLGQYVRGQLVVGSSNAALIGVGVWLLGVPLVLPIMLLVFVGGFLPLIGVTLAGAVAVLVALASGGPATALAMLAVVVVVQQLEGHVIAPLIHGRFVSLHPLAVVVALAVGTVLLGVIGAMLAVPVTASASRAVSYLRRSSMGAVDPEAERRRWASRG